MELIKEIIMEVLEYYEISIPDDAIKDIACGIIALREYESYSMPSYDSHTEIKKLQAELDREKNKIMCTYCLGSGTIETRGPYHGSASTCHYCNGTGKVDL